MGSCEKCIGLNLLAMVAVQVFFCFNLAGEMMVVVQARPVHEGLPARAPEHTASHIRFAVQHSSANASAGPMSVTSGQEGLLRKGGGLSVSLGHVDSPNSPLRPSHCSAGDEACVFHHRISRHAADRRLEQTVQAGPVVSGFETARAVGDYYVRFTIGDPGRVNQILLLDTASDLLWVQAFPCKKCFDQKSTPKFFPMVSPSNKNLGCSDPMCEALMRQPAGTYTGCGPSTCAYKKTYTRGTGAFTAGELAKESFTFRTSGAGSPFIIQGVVYGKALETVFPSPPVGSSGVLGLGGGNNGSPFSFATQIGGNFGNQFSFCLPTTASTSFSTLDFGPDSMTSPARTYYMPLLGGGNPNFYYVGLRSISVGGREVTGIPPGTFSIRSSTEGGVIVDTATPYTVLTSAAYDPFQEAFIESTQALGLGPVYRTGLPQYFDLFDTCWDVTGKDKGPVVIPEVKFTFQDGGYITIGQRSLVVRVIDGQNTALCLAILRAKDSVNAIGNFQLQNVRLGFDLRNNRLGWATNACR